MIFGKNKLHKANKWCTSNFMLMNG